MIILSPVTRSYMERCPMFTFPRLHLSYTTRRQSRTGVKQEVGDAKSVGWSKSPLDLQAPRVNDVPPSDGDMQPAQHVATGAELRREKISVNRVDPNTSRVTWTARPDS